MSNATGSSCRNVNVQSETEHHSKSLITLAVLRLCCCCAWSWSTVLVLCHTAEVCAVDLVQEVHHITHAPLPRDTAHQMLSFLTGASGRSTVARSTLECPSVEYFHGHSSTKPSEHRSTSPVLCFVLHFGGGKLLFGL